MDQFNEGYDIEGLAKELELDFNELAGLYSGYIAEMKEEASQLTDYLAKKDWLMLQRVVHNIKGVSANLTVADVFKEAEKLDIMLKKNVNDGAEVCVRRIIELICNAEKKIRAFFIKKGLEI